MRGVEVKCVEGPSQTRLNNTVFNPARPQSLGRRNMKRREGEGAEGFKEGREKV